MRERSLLSNATSLLVCGLLAGVVVAAAAFPAVAFTGLTAKKGSDSFENLPANLKIPPQPQISYLYANDGKTLIAQIYDENRKDVSISDVAPIMQKAMVAAEDTRFYQHHGVDVKGVVRALVANGSSGQVSQGSSTLTMQYVRNVLKTDPTRSEQERIEATADTPARKLTEMRYAVALEKKLSKKEILERYLNISYFGHGAYGIYAASEAYFSKPPSKLTASEAATIAGIVQTPDQDPTKDMKYATQRRNYVLNSMYKMGYLTKSESTKLRNEPIHLHLGKTPNGCTSVANKHNDWGFFCDYVVRWWRQQKAFGANSAQRELNLKQGGYKIITSLDPKTQKEAMKQSLALYSKNDPKILPIAAVEPGTGHVLALAVNRIYSLDRAKNPGGKKYPRTTDPLITGTGDNSSVGYQTGSTFKMFTMLAALSQKNPDGSHKFPLDTGFQAPKRYTTPYPVGPGPAACPGPNGGYVYCVVNDQSSGNYMAGYRTMWNGFAHSVNTYFVWLEQQVGPQNAVNMAKKLGIKFHGNPNQGPENASDAWLSNHAEQWGAFTLGVSATFPLDLANAYATVAADGKYCSPNPTLKIIDNRGRSVAAAKSDCHQAIDPDVARAATDAARCTVNNTPYLGDCNGEGGSNGTAYPSATGIIDQQFAGKTGTSENESTESFAGFTTQVAAAGTAVDPLNPQTDPVGGYVAQTVDHSVTMTIKKAMEGRPRVDFKKESKAIAYGKKGYKAAAPAPKKPEKPEDHGHDHGGGDDHGGLPHDPGNPGNGPTGPGNGDHPGGWTPPIVNERTRIS